MNLNEKMKKKLGVRYDEPVDVCKNENKLCLATILLATFTHRVHTKIVNYDAPGMQF